MTDSQINEVREKIRAEYKVKMDALQAEMDELLTAVPQMAAYFEATAGGKNTLRAKKRPVRRIPAKTENQPTSEERILACKTRVQGRFHRKDIHEVVNRDGFGEMPEGTFSAAFSKLTKKSHDLVEVEHMEGNQPSTYMWTDEHKQATERSGATI